MYDAATKSLWSTLMGKPVIGPLVGKEIALKSQYVVTSTWGEWKTRHPDTTVLSLDTGYNRDYDEGVAYKKYFATQDLMFAVPKLDSRLRNKDEVLAIRYGNARLAIAMSLLAKNPVYHNVVGKQDLVVLTDRSGASRVFESGDEKFVSWDQENVAITDDGRKWRVEEDSLTSAGQTLRRLPAHRAFWFGWFAQFPETRLVK